MGGETKQRSCYREVKPLAVAQPQLAPRDQEALKIIAERLAQGAPVKAILAELMQREPFNEWSSSGMRKQWVQVWRPALAGQGLLPAAILKKMRSRTRGRAARRGNAAPGGAPASGNGVVTPGAPPAPVPVAQAAPTTSAATLPAAALGAASPAVAQPQGAPHGAHGALHRDDLGQGSDLLAQVAALREALYPLARGAVGQPLTPADLATLFAQATLALRHLEEGVQALAQDCWRLQADASALRQQVQQQEAQLARWDATWRRQQETLALIHQAIAEGLQGEAGEDPSRLRELLQVVQTRVRQMLR